MKTIFKSLAIAALFVGIGSTAHAQLGAQTSTSVTARILKQITFAHTDTIQFGTVAAGGGQTELNPINQSLSSNVGFNSRIGRLVIDATAEEPLRVEFDTEVTMRTVSNSDSITFRPIISAVRGDRTINPADRLLSVLVSDQAIVNPITDVTGPSGTGQGPVCLITTNAGSDRATLYLGGRLHPHGTTNPIPISGPTGTFRGILNFNVLYAN